MLRTFGDETPEIEYPCDWTYKLVGRDEARLRSVVAEITDREYTLEFSKTSRTGKYVSLELVLRVRGDEDRRAIGQRLHDHVDVLFVF